MIHRRPPPGVLEAMRACLEQTEAIVAVCDPQDILRFANASFERRFLRGRALPLPFEEVLRHGFANGFGVHVSSGDIDSFIASVLARRRAAPFRAFEVDTLEGEWIWMTETLVDDWVLSFGSIITVLKDHERVLQRDRDRARHAAETDALTGVCNRRRILEIAEQTIAAQTSRPTSVAIIDLDHFKLINDTLGHAAGDEVLAQFATYCASCLRQDDGFGRYGGEEFLVVLPGTPQPAALGVLERIRERLVPAVLATGARHGYTFSAGVAEAAPGESLGAVLRRADEALYRAKARGRDRAEVASADTT